MLGRKWKKQIVKDILGLMKTSVYLEGHSQGVSDRIGSLEVRLKRLEKEHYDNHK